MTEATAHFCAGILVGAGVMSYVLAIVAESYRARIRAVEQAAELTEMMQSKDRLRRAAAEARSAVAKARSTERYQSEISKVKDNG